MLSVEHIDLVKKWRNKYRSPKCRISHNSSLLSSTQISDTWGSAFSRASSRLRFRKPERNELTSVSWKGQEFKIEYNRVEAKTGIILFEPRIVLGVSTGITILRILYSVLSLKIPRCLFSRTSVVIISVSLVVWLRASGGGFTYDKRLTIDQIPI